MEETRKRILKSALETFSKLGYTGSTTREIARLADITEVTLFRHFSSKEKLFEEVVHGSLPGPDFAKIILEAKKLEYSESLESIARAFLDGLKHHEELIKVLYMEYRRHHELMDKIYTALVNSLSILLAEYFKKLQDKGIIRVINPLIMAKIFLSSLFGLFEEEIFFTKHMIGENTEVAVSVCIEIFVRGTKL
ncbi:MAG TPA: TetR/AcrR family transcriptional regulator [Bacteroidales bacterium]|nr:TetR/AcrR family transcriptional regulator [Bacteroidales bacterium]